MVFIAGLALLLATSTMHAAGLGTALPPVTRAEALSTLLHSRTDALPLLHNDGWFPDVRKGDWYEQVMLVGAKMGIVQPDALGRLSPQQPVNRAQFVKMLALTFGLQQDLPHPYRDVPRNVWFSPYAGIAARYRLFWADSDRYSLKPSKMVNREDVASLISLVRDYEEYARIRREQQIAKDQSLQKIQIYLTTSTQRQHVTLVEQTTTPAPSARLSPPLLPGEGTSLTMQRAAVLSLVNLQRAAKGLPALVGNPLLERSAQTYAEQMSAGGFFSHVSPAGQTLRDRIDATGYYDRSYSLECQCTKGYALGENLGRGQRTPAQAVGDWMRSPSHRAAILSSEYTDTGIGISAGIWVQHFGGVLMPQ